MDSSLTADSLLFADPEGLEHELGNRARTRSRLSPPRRRTSPPSTRFAGSTACAPTPWILFAASRLLGETLGFTKDATGRWEARGEERSGFYAYDAALRDVTPRQGAGTVHHVAFASTPAEHEQWRERLELTGANPTPVIDRFYFRSIYFREPSGVLFEIATIGPGFTVDEDEQHLGEHLSLPPRFEPLRAQLERTLTPLPDPRLLHERPGA